jgi:hypothetical protein
MREELISDEPIGLVELVKNSYDAVATRMEIRFVGRDPDRPDKIVFLDDGIGMDLETVLGTWFEPRTATKRKREVSPRGRVYQGAMGIGRFAGARLAESLILESKAADRDVGVLIRLDWGMSDGGEFDAYGRVEKVAVPTVSKQSRLGEIDKHTPIVDSWRS